MSHCTAPYDRNNPKVRRLDSLFIGLFCKEGLPFALVAKSPSFLDFVTELDPRYKPPTPQVLSALMIPVKYDEVEDDIARHLALASTRAAFATDGWTVSNNVAFTGVIMHYNDKD